MKTSDTFFKSALLFVGLHVSLGCTNPANKRSTTPQPTSTEQKATVGGRCDGCELMFVDMPKTINAIDTSEAWSGKGQKLVITGKVYSPDGKTIAPDIVVYYWHTNEDGYYNTPGSGNSNGHLHGKLRGWVKTDANGQFKIYTIRPAPYPNEIFPVHIHLLIKEPTLEDVYYTDEINFSDDPLLNAQIKRYPPENRGGSGVVQVEKEGTTQFVNHKITLGLNIPNYPKR